MAYNYLEPDHLEDALHESEEYMRPFYEPLAELERITKGKPGKVAPGKPKTVTAKLAMIRRELPKQVVQQLGMGKASCRDNPDMEDYLNAIITDIIYPNANSGGTPYNKSKTGVEDVFTIGSSWMHPFFNRRGDLFHGDFKRVYARDISFEKGKVSEFDSNYMWMTGWYTETDLKAIIYWEQKLSKSAKDRKETYTGKWNIKALQELLDAGAKPKDDQNKSEDEKKWQDTNGFFKICHAFQIGKDATFYSYAPAIKKVVKECVTTDRRGIIPLHGFVPNPDHANPLGGSIAALSVSKTNLLDYLTQNFQYHQGMGTDPAIKKWGSTPDSKIQIAPGKVISMMGTRATDDFEPVRMDTTALNMYGDNYARISSEIMEETGFIGGSNISSEANNPSFSKTSAGVKQTNNRTALSVNDLQKQHEAWWGRIMETTLVLHLAESKGEKTLELSNETMKRLKLDKAPTFDYDKDYGRVTFTVDAGTEQASDNEAENEKLTALLELKMKYEAIPDPKNMQMFNQIVKNSGVDDPEKLMYDDDEIAIATETAKLTKQMQLKQLQQSMQPQDQPQQPPKTLGESVSWSPGDLSPNERAQALKQVGIEADEQPTPNQIGQSTDVATKLDKHMMDVHQQNNPAQHMETPNEAETPAEQGTDAPGADMPPAASTGVEEDRALAKQQLLDKGVPEAQAEQMLAQIDAEQAVGQ